MNQTTPAARIPVTQPVVYAVLVGLVTAGLALSAVALEGARPLWLNAPVLPDAAPPPQAPADLPSTPSADGSSPFVPDAIERVAPPDVAPQLPDAPIIFQRPSDPTLPSDPNAPRPMAPGAPFKRYTTDETVPGS